MKVFLYLVCSVLLIQFKVFADNEYILGPGDHVEIKVYGQDDLTLNTRIGNSGKINYPFLGEIIISGLTAKQLQNNIYARLNGDYLIKPSVFVHITKYRAFYIHGEVRTPGGYSYQPGMTINQAVALASGLTERASKEKIFIFKEGDKNIRIQASLNTKVNAGDTITIEQRFF
ncbi:capsular biosynthesis protein [Pseudoalteromonas sp. NBT06-2]|uniref:polysaccharide biosynthesis/export family protein n=1 Tax=Pseudoalteromonas sp. NBT06-2 TaxID=2025950 RepID=UPI000BA686A9|nr:polysaccharide biosynthesis/export family protein [Pseudoalteromonas sp. NBT06-2]PAJ74741.1 capsular biosynthesis protein [Pseudoalteromonas sp. NBT06-2]